MLTIKNKYLKLVMQEDGTGVILEDLVRDERWFLDNNTRLVGSNILRFDPELKEKVRVLNKGKTTKINDNTIISFHDTESGNSILRWSIEKNRLHILAESNYKNNVTTFSLPGTFRPENKNSFLSAIPKSQGILHTGKGQSFYKQLTLCAHRLEISMPMFGQISSKSALLVIAESDKDVSLYWEKTNKGFINLMWIQHPSMGKISYTRETVIILTSPDITSICKTYRKYEIEKNRFKTWQEKISERPILKKLFGSAMIFTGYFKDNELDYAASFRKLKSMGIEKALVYPIFSKSII